MNMFANGISNIGPLAKPRNMTRVRTERDQVNGALWKRWAVCLRTTTSTGSLSLRGSETDPCIPSLDDPIEVDFHLSDGYRAITAASDPCQSVGVNALEVHRLGNVHLQRVSQDQSTEVHVSRGKHEVC